MFVDGYRDDINPKGDQGEISDVNSIFHPKIMTQRRIRLRESHEQKDELRSNPKRKRHKH